MKDLFILVADKDAEQCIKGLLGRWPSLAQFAIREFTYDVIIHPQKDSGCRVHSVDLMRLVHKKYRYGAVLFDHEGCGAENEPATAVAEAVRNQLERNGWRDRVAVFLHKPEVENWIWTNHDRMARTINWDSATDLAQWMRANEWATTDLNKPERPKECFQAALQVSQVQVSSSLFAEIAEEAPLGRCVDPTFKAFIAQLAEWFPLNARRRNG